MKIIALLSVLAACANANHLILDVLQGGQGVITAWSNLRSLVNEPYAPKYEDCKSTVGIRIELGHLGGSVPCKTSQVNVGLYFPGGYNGTVSEVYDYTNKIFYPCTKIINEWPMATYVCPNIITYPIEL